MRKFFVFMLSGAALLAGAIDIPARKNKVNSTIDVLPQVEPHYGVYQNVLHFWKDRPLFMDRTLRYSGTKYQRMTPESIKSDIRILKRYQIPGFSILPGYNLLDGLKMWYNTLDSLPQVPAKLMLAVYTPNQYPGKTNKGNFDYLYEYIKVAINSPKSYRIGGKVVVNSYEATLWKPEQWKNKNAQLRSKLGDKFLFVADMKIPGQRFYQAYSKKGKVTQAEINTYVNTLQQYLDACDGIYIYAIGKKYDFKGEYGSRFDKKFFYDVWRPILWKVMNDPRNKGKLFGVVIQLGYVNHYSGMINCGEYGTETLRESFESALSLNPDFIIPFEWNELNENTCFLPTIYKGNSSETIMRYYQSLIEKRKPVPRAGDDFSLPNAILSYRYQLKYGEPLRMELLTVPDGSPSFTGKATIRLKDTNGKTVKTIGPWIVKHGEYQAQTEVLPSESFSDHQVLIPELELTDRDGKNRLIKGMLYIRFVPSANNIYQYVRQVIRDTPPVTGSLKVSKNHSNWQLAGEVNSSEELQSIELLNNRDEIRAVENKPEYDLNKETVIRMRLTGKPQYLTGKIRILNAGAVKSRSAATDCNHEFFSYKTLSDGLDCQRAGFGLNTRYLLFAFDSAKNNQAVIDIDSNIGKFQIPVKDIINNGNAYAIAVKLAHWRFEVLHTLPDIPNKLTGKQAKFNFQVNGSNEKFPVFSIRAITKSGKIWYSVPELPVKVTGKSMPLRIYSETARKAVTIPVAVERIPDIRYQFTPACGAVLRAPYWYDFNGEIGGGWHYCAPFARTVALPKNAKEVAPQWVKDGNGYCLTFDGKGQQISFPLETLPRDAFKLSMEILPSDTNNRILFRHHGSQPGSLSLVLNKGKLVGGFFDSNLKQHRFNTGLTVKENKWNKITVNYDLEFLTFSVDGESKRYPFKHRGRIFATSAFAGPLQPFALPTKAPHQMFAGKLRNLRISHFSGDTATTPLMNFFH